MGHYRRKNEVEAFKFDGSDENTSKILRLIFQAGQKAEWKAGMEAWAHENGIAGYPGSEECIILSTPRGPLFVYKGSWFVKTQADHVEVVTDEVFSSEYEQVSPIVIHIN